MDNFEVTDFGMFTDAGNEAVQAIVEGAISNDLTWDEVYDCLISLSNRAGFEEATDTVVRENVYAAILKNHIIMMVNLTKHRNGMILILIVEVNYVLDGIL